MSQTNIEDEPNQSNSDFGYEDLDSDNNIIFDVDEEKVEDKVVYEDKVEDEYFMAIAFLTAKRSKGSYKQVGVCVINEDNNIVGVGYNDIIRMSSGDGKKIKKLTNYEYVCHAARNAILNKNRADLQNSKIYVTLFPCNECTKCIVQAGIKEVIYLSKNDDPRDKTPASKLMFDTAHIKYRQWIPKREKFSIYFQC